MIEDLINENALKIIREEIIKNNGYEVFFVAKLSNSNGRISLIKPCAWGNDNAVPVVFEEAYKGDYLIHNHPSGNLTPSDNDISLSSHFGNQGIGFIIIDNDATKYFTVVPAVHVTEITPLNSAELAEFLAPGGVISNSLTEYEHRIGQIEMLKSVSDAFNNSMVSVIEAGTGTGKSLAYLLPALFWSIKNKEKIVISTNTINLQEQLIYKDIPFLKKALNLNFNAVLVKGRNNYACLRKIDLILNENELFDDDVEQYRNTLSEWIKTAKTGTKDELSFKVEYDLWEKISSESDECVKARCPDFKDCFFFKARKEMSIANLLIVNHHILCSDISIRKAKSDYTKTALLPVYTKVVIDEAHNIEDAVSSFFGVKISRSGIKRTVSRLLKAGKKRTSGILPFLENKLHKKSVQYQTMKDFDKAFQAIRNVSTNIIGGLDLIDDFFNVISDYCNLKMKGNYDSQMRLLPILHQEDNYKSLLIFSKKCSLYLREISNGLYRTHSILDDLAYYYIEDIVNEVHLLESYAERIAGYASGIEEILECNDTDKVFWLEKKSFKNQNITYLNSSPICVGDLMKDYLFTPIDSVIMTSATLSTGGDFSFFKSRMGLDNMTNKKTDERVLTSHFDYREQALFCIPNDISPPDSSSFDNDYCKYAEKILSITGGATFFLCTSFNQIKNLKKFIENNQNLSHLNVFAQGDVERTTLLNRFITQNNSVLIGTDSFWEGVDVPGDDLKCVIIVKLPFKVPSEPIYQARAEKIEQEGKSSFFNYSLPLSVIKFKQGFGRLVRTSYDEGVVVCLDKRLITKNYGRYFISSLPDLPVVIGNDDDILPQISKFFR